MARIPYKPVGDPLNAAMPFHRYSDQRSGVHPVLAAAFDVLVVHEGIHRIVTWIYDFEDNPPPCRFEVLEQTLMHIVKRTLVFGKVIEFVRINEILNGLPSLNISGLTGSKTNRHPVSNALKWLNDKTLLIKLRLPQPIQTPLYGLHLPNVAALIPFFQCEELKESLSVVRLKDLAKSRPAMPFLIGLGLSCAVREVLVQYRAAFDYLFQQKQSIKNLDNLCGKLKTMGSSCKIKNGEVSGESMFYEVWEIRNNRTKLLELWEEEEYPFYGFFDLVNED